jgi:soluble lytic murein transglycosylase
MRRNLLFLALLLAVASLSAEAGTVAQKQAPYRLAIQRYAARYNIPAELIAAVIDVESHWQPHAVSPKGALGLMQLMPDTARKYGAFDPFNAEQNIAAGTRYLTDLMWLFKGDLRLVIAAYNAGEGRIVRPQLNYRNAGVVGYVKNVRRQYEWRLARPPER